MSTRIVNIKRGEPFDVYIGRACTRARDARCHTRSLFANPRSPEPFESVEEMLDAYEQYLRARLEASPSLVTRLLALEGKTLGCWCKPDPCHGDVIVRLIDEYKGRR